MSDDVGAMRDAFSPLRDESAAVPRTAAMTAARAAMHDERTAVIRRPLTWFESLWADVRRTLTPRRLALTGIPAAAALAAVVAVGWNAPAGSPLHVVRVAREQVALAVPGADRASLELSDAEARLRDARQGTNVSASLADASRLLDDARAHLPADHAAALWRRWRDDENELSSLSAQHESGGDGGTSDGSGGGSDGGDHGGLVTGPGGGESSIGTSTSTSSPSSGGDSHEGGSMTTTTTTSSSGGGDGESRTTTTTTSSSTTSSGGPDGGGSSDNAGH